MEGQKDKRQPSQRHMDRDGNKTPDAIQALSPPQNPVRSQGHSKNLVFIARIVITIDFERYTTKIRQGKTKTTKRRQGQDMAKRTKI